MIQFNFFEEPDMNLTKDGKTIQVGSRVTSFRGEAATVVGWREPRHSGSTGRVLVRFAGETQVSEFYPKVFGLEWHSE